MKTERIQQFKKAFTLYRRGGYSLAYRRYINSSVSNKKVNSAAIVECKGFKVRERQI